MYIRQFVSYVYPYVENIDIHTYIEREKRNDWKYFFKLQESFASKQIFIHTIDVKKRRKVFLSKCADVFVCGDIITKYMHCSVL